MHLSVPDRLTARNDSNGVSSVATRWQKEISVPYILFDVLVFEWDAFLDAIVLPTSDEFFDPTGKSQDKASRTSLYYLGDQIWKQLYKQNREWIYRIGDAFLVIKEEHAV